MVAVFMQPGNKLQPEKYDDNDDDLLLRNGRPTKGVYVLFPVENIVRDSQHCKSPTRREQDLNLRRI